MPLYGGLNIFGASVKCRMEVNPSASQVNEFFGVGGQQSLYGGSRGRIFLVEGLLTGEDVPTLSAAVALFLSFDDGIGRTFSHPVYGDWPSVVFRRFVPGDRVMFGYAITYKAQFDGLV